MIIYFADRELRILGHASTTLPAGYRISDDKTIESVDTGVNTFQCVISYTADTRAELEEAVQVGSYILKQSNSSDADNVYDSLYQIIETEFDTKTQEISLYAEDAGLDLINTLCPAVTLSGTIGEMMLQFLPEDWDLNLIDVPESTRTYTWDGESTATDRLMSVAHLFGCEIYYSFVIDRLQVLAKVVNVDQKRGNQIAIPQLRLNYDVDRIYTKKSIADLITALRVTGGKAEGTDESIDLVGYDYTYIDPRNGDVYEVDKETGQMRNLSAMARWSSVIDEDGLWLGSYTFDTSDKAVLAGQARAQLQRESQVAVSYEVDFEKLPDDIQIGDRINIIDEQGELYLEARLLKIETCETDNTQTATIGEYVLRDSGISDKVAQMASELSALSSRINDYQLTITSSNGSDFTTTLVNTVLTAQIIYRGVKQTASMLDRAGLQVNWYDQNTNLLIGTGLTYTVTNKQKINITARLEDK